MPAKSTLYEQQVRIMTLRLMDRVLPGFFGANLLHLLSVLDTHAAAARAPITATSHRQLIVYKKNIKTQNPLD